MTRRGLILAAAVLPALAALPAASAAAADRTPDARALRQAGWKVTWPSAKQLSAAKPGTRLTVTVAPLAKRPPAKRAVVRVALRRVGGERATRVVARRTLRSGRFAARIPATPAVGARYVLSLNAAGRQYSSTIVIPGRASVPTPAPEPVPAPVVPDPPAIPFRPCEAPVETPASVGVRVHRGQVHPADTVTVTYANTGQACLVYGAPYGWERLVDDRWVRVEQPPRPWPAIAYTLAVGASADDTVTTDADFVPGRYRIVKRFDHEPPGATWREWIPVYGYGEVEVVARH